MKHAQCSFVSLQTFICIIWLHLMCTNMIFSTEIVLTFFLISWLVINLELKLSELSYAFGVGKIITRPRDEETIKLNTTKQSPSYRCLDLLIVYRVLWVTMKSITQNATLCNKFRASTTRSKSKLRYQLQSPR